MELIPLHYFYLFADDTFVHSFIAKVTAHQLKVNRQRWFSMQNFAGFRMISMEKKHFLK